MNRRMTPRRLAEARLAEVAAEVARELSRVPEKVREDQLARLGRENPTFHALVKARFPEAGRAAAQ